MADPAERPVDAAPAEVAAVPPLDASGESADAGITKGDAAVAAAGDQRIGRGMLSDDMQYAVYLHPGALETLGESIVPFLTHGPHGPHIVCTDIDTGGALCEMAVETTTAGGVRQRTEVMFPVAMIRLVTSLGGLANGFGFRSRE